MEITNEWLQEHLKSGDVVKFGQLEMRHPCRVLLLVNGGSLSVQAGQGLYSEPRDLNGPYTHVEVGFAEPLPKWWLNNEDTVMGYVPIHQVIDHVNLHGGVRNKNI